MEWTCVVSWGYSKHKVHRNGPVAWSPRVEVSQREESKGTMLVLGVGKSLFPGAFLISSSWRITVGPVAVSGVVRALWDSGFY